jgi:predicted kinase
MEKQLNSKLTLVLMAGLAGSGKTTLAKALGRELGWLVLSRDQYKTWLLEMHVETPEDVTGRNAYDLVLNQAREFLVEQRLSLILDTAAHFSFILEQATLITLSAEANLKIIHCTATSQIRKTRLIERIVSGKHPKFMGKMKSLEIVDEDEHFKHLPTNILKIDTSNPFEICLETALQYLH